MRKVKLTITESACRGGYHRAGDSFLVEDLCPPLCHELWNGIYPLRFLAMKCRSGLSKVKHALLKPFRKKQ